MKSKIVIEGELSLQNEPQDNTPYLKQVNDKISPKYVTCICWLAQTFRLFNIVYKWYDMHKKTMPVENTLYCITF